MNGFSLGEFAAHLLSIDADLADAQERACKRAMKMVEREAKSAIGHYRMNYGPWPQLAQSTQNQRERLGYARNKPLLREGNLWESISHDGPYRNGDEVYGYVGSPSKVAAYQELGTAHIPPRSFLGGAARVKEAEIHQMVERVVSSTFAHGGKNFRAWTKAFDYLERAWENFKDMGPDESDYPDRR